MQLENKNITVIGMGRTGIATANFLAAKCALVTLIDSNFVQNWKTLFDP